MNSDRAGIRARAALDQWFVLVVVVLLALSAFGGWMTYSAYAAEPEPADQRTVEVWSTTGGYQHSATVQTPNPVFEVGEELTNQQLYYTRLMPELEGEFTYRYDGADGDVDVQTTLEQEVRSVDSDGNEYWSVTEPVAQERVEGLEPGEAQSIDFTVDVPGVANETDRIESSLGSTPGDIETVLVARVTVSGTIDGESVEHRDRYELLVEPDGDTYSVDGPMNERYAEERTETVDDDDVAAGFEPSDAAGGIVVLLTSLVALGVLTTKKYRGSLAPSQAELEAVQREHEREQFDDWITRGVLPDEVFTKPRVSVDSLEGLVDVAIDCDKRVIEEQTEDGPSYWIVDDGVLYVYEPVESVLEEVEGAEDDRDKFDDADETAGLDSSEAAVLGNAEEESVSQEDD
ncbi:DUF5305 domain-containing protein [Natrialbaceae archaeon A-chndr2]